MLQGTQRGHLTFRSLGGLGTSHLHRDLEQIGNFMMKREREEDRMVARERKRNREGGKERGEGGGERGHLCAYMHPPVWTRVEKLVLVYLPQHFSTLVSETESLTEPAARRFE